MEDLGFADASHPCSRMSWCVVFLDQDLGKMGGSETGILHLESMDF